MAILTLRMSSVVSLVLEPENERLADVQGHEGRGAALPFARPVPEAGRAAPRLRAATGAQGSRQSGVTLRSDGEAQDVDPAGGVRRAQGVQEHARVRAIRRRDREQIQDGVRAGPHGRTVHQADRHQGAAEGARRRGEGRLPVQARLGLVLSRLQRHERDEARRAAGYSLPGQPALQVVFGGDGQAERETVAQDIRAVRPDPPHRRAHAGSVP